MRRCSKPTCAIGVAQRNGGTRSGRSWSGTLVQVLFRKPVSDELGHRLRQLLLELGQHAGRRDQDQLVEAAALLLAVDLAGNMFDEILFGGRVLVTARLEGVPHGSRALPDPRRTIGAEIMRAPACISEETKLAMVWKSPSSPRATKRALPPSAIT